MGLILRQQLNDTNPSGISITGSALSYAQADSNFIYLLTNMSGSNISITGSTDIRGNITTTGNITMTGPQQIFGTASWALNTLVNLHQVTTNGNITTNAIALTSSNALHELVLVPLDSFSGDEPAIYIKVDNNTEYHKITIDGYQMGYGGESLTLTKPASLPVGGTTLTYPTSSGIFAVSVNETASNAGGNITLTTVPTASRALFAQSATVPTLQQVTTAGNVTGNNIQLIGESFFSQPQGINLYTGTGGFPGTRARVEIYDTIFVASQTLTVNGTKFETLGGSLSLALGAINSNYILTYPITAGTFALRVNGVDSDSSGSITLTTVPTASFVTASNVWGPHGTSSVISSSYAISASWAPSIPTGSFLTTGSLTTTQQLSGSLDVTGSLNFFSGSTNASKIENGWVILSQVSASLDFANDTAAAAGGVPLGGLYRSGSTILIRII